MTDKKKITFTNHKWKEIKMNRKVFRCEKCGVLKYTGMKWGECEYSIPNTTKTTLINPKCLTIITCHNLFGGNKQLWYLGSTLSSNDNITMNESIKEDAR